MVRSEVIYQHGFGNQFQSEARPGSLPRRGNNPQKPAFGLYAEQLSGVAFTALPHENLRSWLYRLSPSVAHRPFEPYTGSPLFLSARDESVITPPNQLRWDPMPFAQGEGELELELEFVDGIKTLLTSGSASGRTGSAVHYYHATKSMTDRFFYNADGELLIVPESGTLFFDTEFGSFVVSPGEIAVLPRGVKCRVGLDGPCRGYINENFGASYRLPHRGPIGANGLANERDFRYPVARFFDEAGQFKLIAKFNDRLWQAELDHHPLDVVAWHGNLAPYVYDLSLFNTINTVSFDHPDPSIFTVLTSPTSQVGVCNVDFVIFPERWMVAEDTFRPPYFHRNIMSEYMGLIKGDYDAKSSDGFRPGGGSLHSCMTPHGPDVGAFKDASGAKLEPRKMTDTLAFMFETSLTFELSKFALETPALQKDYYKCWQGFPRSTSL